MTFAAAAANIGLWQFDRDTDELWVTEHGKALFGLPSDAPLTRKAFLAAVHPDDMETARRSLRKSFRAERSTASDVRIVLPSGKTRWIRMRARSYAESNGEPKQLGGIFVDITDQKSAEAETALQRVEIEHLMRVSVLGELSGSIAHEVNQPLTAILSNAQAALHLLKQNSPDLAEIRDALEDIVHEDNRAGEVIHRLRGLLKKGERKMESVNVNDLVRSTVRLLHSELIGRDISLRLDLDHDPFFTRGDFVQLQQVLLNLVMNAMDAMASTPMAQRSILISTRGAKTGMVDVLVKDRGHGIRPKENGRLFEPFYTTKAHGLGLGLALCSTIIEAHQGKLTLVNGEGGGAIARFSLPAQQPTFRYRMTDKFTVYLVDDDPGVLKGLSRLLRAKGYEVKPYSSPQVFLDEHDMAVPGCAVLDVSMPGLDGLEIQDVLTTASGSHRPIVFVTGKGDIPTSVRAMKAGAIDFLTKPVKDQDLFEALSRAEAMDAELRRLRSELDVMQAKVRTLTPREREVLTHVVAGRLNKQHVLTAAGGLHRPVVFVTGKGDIPTSVRAMKAGAIDFLTKPVKEKDLIEALSRAEARDTELRRIQSEL